jgi:hypothetical protein
MGIPSTAFQTGDLYIEYGFEEVLFRYEKQTARFFHKFYNESHEQEAPHDSKLLCEARCSGVLTTAERYFSGGAPVADPSADSFPRMAVNYQRIRPYWLSVMHLNHYTRSGDIEVGADGRLEVIKAADCIKGLLEGVVADISSHPRLNVICMDDTPITVDKTSKDYDFGLRLELKKRDLAVIAESSFYLGRSSL